MKTIEDILAAGHSILVTKMDEGKMISTDMAGTPHVWLRQDEGETEAGLWASLAFPQVTSKAAPQAGRDLLGFGPIAVAWGAST